MGIQGAGKSRIADTYVERGYLRLNRDERGGTLRSSSAHSTRRSTPAPARSFSTTRTSRGPGATTSSRRRRATACPARCVWLDTPLAQAQVNLVERLLDRFDRLLSPEELKSRRPQGARRADADAADAGAARARAAGRRRGVRERGARAVLTGAARRAPGRLRRSGRCRASPPRHDRRGRAAPRVRLAARRRSAADLDTLAARIPAAIVETAACTHGGGPPSCWCRPPLPGLPLEFARRHGVDPARSVLVGTSTAHRTLANVLGRPTSTRAAS